MHEQDGDRTPQTKATIERATRLRARSRPGGAHVLDDRALSVLEFGVIAERLGALTSFSAGRLLATQVRPVADRDEVVRRQRELAEALELDRLGIDLSLAGAHDVRPAAEGARLGQSLASETLLNIASTARCAERLRRAAQRIRPEAPLIGTRAASIPELAAVQQLIDSSIDERGEVRDGASDELRAIRREANDTHERLQQRVQSLLNAPAIRPSLQEPIVTLRDGRYVLPVRAEARGAVRGVVHDTSASGATVYIEPMAVVELGNRWRELQIHERHEVDRILRDISAAVGEVASDLVAAVERLAEIDLAVARGRLARELDAHELHVPGAAQPWIVEAPGELRLVDARHPLLGEGVVPISLSAGGTTRALLITGPNTGGKTVALKTAGLLCLLALAGLPVPAAAGTRIPAYESIHADIGDEQSIEQSLSTFSGHITAIIDVIERSGERSLVLLDELGAGTDPVEGAALGIAIVEELASRGVTLIATTHHSELKLYAHRTEGVANASVEFDLETLAPTYRLAMGLPGQSNALAIAGRLGMPATVIERARSTLSDDQQDLESLLADLRGQLGSAERRAQEAASEAARAKDLRIELDSALRDLQEDSKHMREEALRQLRLDLHDVERLVEKTRREVEAARITQARTDLERARALSDRLAEAEQADATPAPPTASLSPALIRPGASVWLRGIGAPGEALSAPDDRGEFDVRLGSLRTRTRIEQVERAAGGAPEEAVSVNTSRLTDLTVEAPEEIEVRGRRIDEALPDVEAFIDLAARAGRPRVRLIHGRGTGTLRRAVRELCARHPLVTRFEPADRSEGGEGVTIAYLARVG